MVSFTDSDDGGESAPARPVGGLAPVISLFPGRTPVVSFAEDDEDEGYDDELADGGYDAYSPNERDSLDELRSRAEHDLTKRLRTRQLSVVEARAVIAEHDVDAETVDLVIERFVHLGYLDDAALAEQLVRSGSERKGQGRRAIAQTLAKRSVPRDVADAALAGLPEDDAERALEFARTKARSMASLERDTALRRLAGQLSRRGYPGGVAFAAAGQALDELGSRSGVRFR